MTEVLRYGRTGSIRFDWPQPIDVTDCAAPRGAPLTDPAAAARRAVESPEGFPPLGAATVPGDRIVLAVDAETPQAAEIVAGVVDALLAAGADPRDITLVGTQATVDLKAALADATREVVRAVAHDPDDVQQLAYLAASHDAQPIYVNRWLTDADLLVPIGILHVDHSLGYLGPSSGVFPAFSDRATQRRFATRDSADWRKNESQRRNDADEAVWLLGVQFVVQVVPGPGESLLHILAGDPTAVAQRGRDLCAAAWTHVVPRRAGLVVASLEGGPEQQTWSHFARALSAAASVVEEDGAIVLCTELNTPPGPTMKEAARTLVAEAPRRRRRKREVDQDTLPAAMLSEVARQHRVYLLSQLDEDTVEELGMARISDPAEIARLGRLHDSCILIGGAQHATLTISDDVSLDDGSSGDVTSSTAEPPLAPDVTSDFARPDASDAFLLELVGRTRIELTGQDRASFLHGLCTNDIKRLQPGQGCEAFFCNVQGKILGHALIFASDDALTIDASPGQSNLLKHLDRYLIREDVQLRDISAQCREWLLYGSQAAAVASRAGLPWPDARLGHVRGSLAGQTVDVYRVDWLDPDALLIATVPAGDASNDVARVAADPAADGRVADALRDAGAAAGSLEWFDWRRVNAGTPLHGRDISADNLPQEVARDERAISFNKGCYLGQEPIARIDALGHVNWRLVGLERPDRSELPLGELAGADGKVVARVTSSVRVPDGAAWFALAYVRRGHNAPGTRLSGPWGEAVVVAVPRPIPDGQAFPTRVAPEPASATPTLSDAQRK